jgi:hypothetical protein
MISGCALSRLHSQPLMRNPADSPAIENSGRIPLFLLSVPFMSGCECKRARSVSAIARNIKRSAQPEITDAKKSNLAEN